MANHAVAPRDLAQLLVGQAVGVRVVAPDARVTGHDGAAGVELPEDGRPRLRASRLEAVWRGLQRRARGVHLVAVDPQVATLEAAVRAGMRRHTESCVPWEEYAELTIVARADDGSVVSAALGDTGRGWLHISVIWVDERFRRQQLGRQLVTMMEKEALQRGCSAAWLDTFSYQARPFYERHGYEVVCTIPDYPQGHEHYMLTKTF